MKRLTKRGSNGKAQVNCNACHKQGICYDSTACVSVLARRLADIEDILGNDYDLEALRSTMEAKKKGLVTILPCPVGAPVFVIGGKYHGGHFEKWRNSSTFRLSDLEKMGKTVFLTAEEADKALETYKEIYDAERGM